MNDSTILAAVVYVLDSEVRPLLHFHGGDVRISEISSDGRVCLEYLAACHGCNLQVVMHFVNVRERLLKIKGVTEVVADGVRISEAAQQRINTACS